MANNAKMYMQIDGGKVKGESTAKGHTDWIELLGYSFGGTNATSISSATTGGGAGEVSLSTLNVTKPLDASSPSLFQQMCQGQHFGKVVIDVVKAGGKDPVKMLTIELEKVFINSIVHHHSADSEHSTPVEQLQLAFGSIHSKYTGQKDDGTAGASTEGGWNVQTGEPK